MLNVNCEMLTWLQKDLKHLGLWKFAGAVMYVLKEVLGLSEEKMIVPMDEKRGRLLLAEILDGGNFGRHFTKYAGFTHQSMGKKYFLKIWRNMHFVRYYSAEALHISVSYLLDESETDSQSHIDQDMFILEAKENFGSKGAKEAQEVLGRVNSLFAGGELDEDAKDVFFQAIMSVYMDSKKTAREKYTPKKYRKHKDKE